MSKTPDNGGHQADHDRQPHAVDALAHRPATVPGAEAAGDAAGGAVGQEDAKANDRLQDRGGDAEPRQLGGAEMTDDGRVGEQEKRLGDQCEKRRKGKTQDLAVRRAQHVPNASRVRGLDASCFVQRGLWIHSPCRARFAVRRALSTCLQATGGLRQDEQSCLPSISPPHL